MSEEVPAEIQQIVTEAKSGFDLKAKLQGRAMRTASVTVYTDEVLGEAHLKALNEINALRELIKPKEGVVLSDEVIASATEGIATHKPAVDAARAELEKTAITFNLRAVPNIIIKDATRRARASVNVKSGNIPEDQAENYASFFNSYLLSKVITGYRLHETDESITTVTQDDAQTLTDYLPIFEFIKLKNAMDDLQTTNAISDMVTESADFSQAG